jgi:hypothetical protein
MDPRQFGAVLEEDKVSPEQFGAIASQEPAVEDESGFWDEALGVGEAALAIGSGIVAEPIAGLVGIGSAVMGGAEAGAKTVEETKEALTYEPRTEEGKEDIQAVGEFMQPVGEAFKSAEDFLGDIGYEIAGPAGGAAGATIPTATLELLGLKGIRKVRGPNKITGIPDDVILDLEKRGLDIGDVSPSGLAKIQSKIKEGISKKAEDIKPPEKKQYETILKNIERNKLKKSAGEVMPDQEIVDAAKELGIDLNPSHYSTNKAYMEVEQSLKSRPGSMLSARELKAIDDLGSRADSLINDLGGTTDKSLIDLKVKNEIAGSIDSLSELAGTAYTKVDSAIPKATIVDAPTSKAYINQIVDDLGGDVSRLSPAEKDLYNLSKNEKITYSALDRMRKNIGRGFKKQGIYKDEDAGLLKQAYRQISEDQQKVADAFGVGDDYSLGRKLVADRKTIENQSMALFGREVNKSIIPQMKQSATALTKGDISKFNKLIKALPESLREEAAVTMLGHLFVQDARSATGLSQGFVKAFEGLNRNKQAKAELFKYLPEESRRRFNNIGKVATGLYRSKALKNTSRTALDLIAAMDDGGMFRRLTDTGRKVAMAEGVSTSVGLPGAGAAGVLGTILARGRKPASEAADAFITSEKFSKAIKEAAEGNVKSANEMIKKSPKFKNWVKFANKGDAEAIATVGFIPWLTGQTEEENVK